ncbi:MAG: hypothetical protein FJZ01_18325 [Candidatus Sericytochromatia bacterium]|nr:hypothetical protein [Candidatus Tanganyikabacteria bacterium]
MDVKTNSLTPGSAPAGPRQADAPKAALPKPQIGTDGLTMSQKAAGAAVKSEGDKLADLKERAMLAAGAVIPPVGIALAAERAKPGLLKRIANGMKVAMSPVWAPIGLLWQFGLNLGQGLQKKEFSPVKALTGAADTVRKDVSSSWGIAMGTSHHFGPRGVASKLGTAPVTQPPPDQAR